MNPIVEFASFAIIIAALILSLIYIVILRVRLRNLSSTLIQTGIDANYVKSKLAEALLQIESNKLQETDGFVKFISDSRDWAFKYIEDVEKYFNEFDTSMQTIFQWAKTYGNTNGETAHSEAINEIEKAYNEFKKTMPNNKEK